MTRRLLGEVTVQFGANGNGGNPGDSTGNPGAQPPVPPDPWAKMIPAPGALLPGERFEYEADVVISTPDGMRLQFNEQAGGLAVGYCDGTVPADLQQPDGPRVQFCPPFLDCHNLFALPYTAQIRGYGVSA